MLHVHYVQFDDNQLTITVWQVKFDMVIQILYLKLQTWQHCNTFVMSDNFQVVKVYSYCVSGHYPSSCFLFEAHNILETGFCLCLQVKPTHLGPTALSPDLQVKPTHLGPTDRASPYLLTSTCSNFLNFGYIPRPYWLCK
jgi:hypothetical protein